MPPTHVKLVHDDERIHFAMQALDVGQDTEKLLRRGEVVKLTVIVLKRLDLLFRGSNLWEISLCIQRRLNPTLADCQQQACS